MVVKARRGKEDKGEPVADWYVGKHLITALDTLLLAPLGLPQHVNQHEGTYSSFCDLVFSWAYLIFYLLNLLAVKFGVKSL